MDSKGCHTGTMPTGGVCEQGKYFVQLCYSAINSSLNPSNAAWGCFRPKHKDATILENNLNPVILVIIR